MTDKTEVQQIAVQQMPTTPDELRVFVVEALKQILSIPENVIQLAQQIFAAGANATQVQSERDVREGLRPVLTRVYYPGAFRATVSGEVDAPMTVKLEHKPEGSEVWEDCREVINPSAYEALSKLVLSQPTIPNDVWYITTNAAVNAQQEKVTDIMMGKGEVEPLKEAAPLDLDEVERDVVAQKEVLH